MFLFSLSGSIIWNEINSVGIIRPKDGNFKSFSFFGFTPAFLGELDQFLLLLVFAVR